MTARPWPSLLLVGPTGSGKSPLGDELEQRGLRGRRCLHFDFGANLRAIAAAPEGTSGFGTAEVLAIRTSLATGALFEDRDIALIIKVLQRFVAARDWTPGSLLILNGLPRHRGQAELLAGAVTVERVIVLDAGAGVIRERIRLDPGGDRAGRADDTLEAIGRRMADYRARTMPLVEFYRERGVPVSVISVTAGMSAAEMHEALERDMPGEGRLP